MDPSHTNTCIGDMWDSGWIISCESAMIAYGGQKLKSMSDYYAVVHVENSDNHLVVTSLPVKFRMGFPLKSASMDSEWEASWLTSPNPWANSPMFRKHFKLGESIEQAYLYISGLGYYEAFLNGCRIGHNKLDPTWTDFEKRISYVTYDVGSMLESGDNVIGIILGNGWFGLDERRNPIFTAQLYVRYTNNAEVWVRTGPGMGWLTLVQSPILKNSLYNGEVYDARLEIDNWSCRDDGEATDTDFPWVPAIEAEPPAGIMVPQSIEPIRIVAELEPKLILERLPGVYVVDFGQNIAGIVRLRIQSEPGSHIIIRHSELLDEDANLNTLNLRSASATDEYIARGGEVWYEPRFTYHGFRYVEISGLGHSLDKGDVRALCLRNDVDIRGTFSCSNELVNRIQKMCMWTEGNNLHGVPTDCPQRDERLGWLNDLTVRAEEAIFNFDLHVFFTKYMLDIADAQGKKTGAITDTVPYKLYGGQPADAVCSSYLVIPWLIYQHYGDKSILRRHYQGLYAWISYLERQTEEGIVIYSYYGDWASPITGSILGSAGSGAVSSITPGRLMSTGFLLLNAKLMAFIAEILEKGEDKLRFEELAHKTREALNTHYFDRERCTYASGSQAANTFMLYLDVVPMAARKAVVDNLVADILAHDTHLTTRNLCTKYILEVLCDYGHTDLAYALVTQTTYPSWGYMLECGATTTWERWEYVTSGPELGMASHDHPMNATVSAWFYRYLAGIRIEKPGFGLFSVRPYPPHSLKWVCADLVTVKGKIGIRWEQHEDRFEMQITVPNNSQCRVEIPEQYEGEVSSNGKNAERIMIINGRRSLMLPSGQQNLVVYRLERKIGRT